MRRNIKMNRLLAVFLLSLALSGCGKGASPSPAPETTAAAVKETPAAEQTIAETSTESKSVEEVPEVDRYKEMINPSAEEGKLTFYCWDIRVGEDADDKAGDSTLFISPDGKTMLLDAGHPDCADQVIGYLKDLGITKLDYFVASHPHIDHIGSFPEIARNFEIGTAYRSHVEYTTNTYQNYVDAMEEHEIPVE